MNHHKIALAAVIAIIIVFIAAFTVGYYKTNQNKMMNSRMINMLNNSTLSNHEAMLATTGEKQEAPVVNSTGEKKPVDEFGVAQNVIDNKTGDVSNPGGKTGATTPTADNEPPLTKADLKDIPEEFQPSEATALEAALVGIDGWVGKITTHSNDWATATVLIGPPQSEYVQELYLKWNRKGGYYDVVRKKGVQ